MTNQPEGFSYPIRQHSRIELLVDGVEMFHSLCSSIENATCSVHATIAFINIDLLMPYNRGTILDVLISAAQRGVKVYLLIWRNPHFGATFNGTKDQITMLHRRCKEENTNDNLIIRWDASPNNSHCHHQKSWIIDYNNPFPAIAFVGGINPIKGAVRTSDHSRSHDSAVDDPYPDVHDVFSKVYGDAVMDIFHNFVQRWNECHNRFENSQYFPNPAVACDIHPFPPRPLPLEDNNDETLCPPVQVSRTMPPGLYRRGDAVYNGRVNNIMESGESSVKIHYINAISKATSYIYCENQHFFHKEILEHMIAAANRGVIVVGVVPINPMRPIWKERKLYDEYQKNPQSVTNLPKYKTEFDRFLELGRHENFHLLGLLNQDGPHKYHSIYVHSKVMVIDDQWFTIGSANMVDLSMDADHSELNISSWCSDTARQMLVRLLKEHCGEHLPRSLSGKSLLEHTIKLAKQNTKNWKHDMYGHIVELCPHTYATTESSFALQTLN